MVTHGIFYPALLFLNKVSTQNFKILKNHGSGFFMYKIMNKIYD